MKKKTLLSADIVRYDDWAGQAILCCFVALIKFGKESLFFAKSTFWRGENFFCMYFFLYYYPTLSSMWHFKDLKLYFNVIMHKIKYLSYKMMYNMNTDARV